MFNKDFMINWLVATVFIVVLSYLLNIPDTLVGFCVEVVIGIVGIVLFRETLKVFQKEKTND